MKKLTSLMAALVLSLTMLFGAAMADTEVLAGGNGTVPADKIAAAGEDAKLVLVVKCVEATAGQGWGVGGICFDGWGVDSDFEIILEAAPVVGEELTVEFSIADIKAKGASEVNVNLYNGYELVTATIVEAAAAPTPEATPEVTPEAGTTEEAPQTGDAMNIVVLAALAVVALGGTVLCVSKKNA